MGQVHIVDLVKLPHESLKPGSYFDRPVMKSAFSLEKKSSFSPGEDINQQRKLKPAHNFITPTTQNTFKG